MIFLKMAECREPTVTVIWIFQCFNNSLSEMWYNSITTNTVCSLSAFLQVTFDTKVQGSFLYQFEVDFHLNMIFFPFRHMSNFTSNTPFFPFVKGLYNEI